MDGSAWVALAVAVVGAVIYIVRAEQASVSEKIASDLKSHVDGCEIRERQHDERHAESIKRLDRMDAKLDRLLQK